MTTAMPGDPRVLQRRVFVTLMVTIAVLSSVSIVGVFAGLQLRFGWLWMFLPGIVVGVVTSLVWTRRARTASRRIVAELFDGSPPSPPEAGGLVEQLDEIRGLIDDPRFWRLSMAAARRGNGARCRELADDAREYGLDLVASRLLVLGDVLDPGRVDLGSDGSHEH